MRIDCLHIQNFRSFENESFDFDPHLNVLIGDNGAGKTALLEATAVAAGSFFLGIGGESGRSITRDDIRYVPRQEGDQINFQPQTPTVVEAKGWALYEDRPLRWRRELGSEKGRTTTAQAWEIREMGEHAEQVVQSGEQITLPVIAYYGAGRLWQTRKLTKADRQGANKAERQRLYGYSGAIDPRVDSRSFLNWMRLQAQIRFEEEAEPQLLRAVRRALAEMIEGARDVDYRAKWKDVVVFFEHRDAQPFGRLSDGQRNALALAGDLATRIARLNPHLGDGIFRRTPGIVLIDEIETHLHPTWQRRILDDLRRTFPEVQFIVTTHSPQVLGEVPPRHIIRLNMGGHDQPTRAFGLDANAILDEVMGAESQSEVVHAPLSQILSAIHSHDLGKAEARIREFREYLRTTRGVDYDPPELRRAEAAFERVRIIGR